AAAKLKAQIFGREKTLYSIYTKMREKHLTFAQVSDIFGFRIVVGTLPECYMALGVLHQLMKPVPGRFKDYIAIPKANGYQSLHDIQDETRDAGEFLEHVKIDLYPDAVYVFTPMSKILALPRGATPVDFAYAIHTDVGDHCVAANVNGEPVPLRAELKSGDVVEIIGAPNARPNPGWLNFVVTGRARSKIRHYLKNMEQEESQSLGEKMLAQALRAEGLALPPED